MKSSLLDFIKKYLRLKIVIPVSLTGLIASSIALFYFKISFFEKGIENVIVNVGGIVHVQSGEQAKKTPLVLSDITSSDKLVETQKEIISNSTTSSQLNISHIDIVLPEKINNDSFETATPVENGKKYSEALIKKSDARFYSFTLEKSGFINFSFVSYNARSYKLSILNSSRNMVFQTEISNENTSSRRGNVYLLEGTYFIEITGGDVWTEDTQNNNYSIITKISNNINEAMEAENNNTEATANLIQINTPVKASTYKGDIDYFEFILKKKTLLYPKLEFKPVFDNNKEIYNLKLYELIIKDELGTDIDKIIFRGDNKISGKNKPIILEAGKYIICVSRVEEKSKIALGLHEYILYISTEMK